MPIIEFNGQIRIYGEFVVVTEPPDNSAPVLTVPQNQSAVSITHNAAILTWDAVPGATSYNVRYKESSAANWTTATTTNTAFPLSGLTAETDYVFAVQADNGSEQSSFPQAIPFSTKPAPVVGSCAAPSVSIVGTASSGTAVISIA